MANDTTHRPFSRPQVMRGFSAGLGGAAALGLLFSLVAPTSATAADARVLDDESRLVTVGNWRTLVDDDGTRFRVPDTRVLSWELREGETLLAEGVVPGTDDGLLDAQAALSRNPVTGELLLVWSRQTARGTRELAAIRHADGEFALADERVLAEGTTNQLDPVVVHDAAGRAHVAWRDADTTGRIMLLSLDVSLQELSRQELSEDLSERNGPPLLGVDARGGIFAAFTGHEPGSTETRVFVLSAGELGGGVLHNPLPILDLAVRTDQPLPLSAGSVDEGDEEATERRLHSTVLAGTGVVWWSETTTDGRLLVRYLHQATDSGWEDVEPGVIALPASPSAGVHEALRLLEDRIRRVVARFGDEAARPVGLPGRDLVRR